MATIYHQVWLSAPVAKVYEAISTPAAIGTWWDDQTPVETEAGLVLEHFPGPEHGVVRMKVLERSRNTRVEWECISTHPETSPASAWTGTRVSFDLSEQRPAWASPTADAAVMTVLDFRHSGWDANSRYLGFCSFAWAEVLQSLKRGCEARPGS